VTHEPNFSHLIVRSKIYRGLTLLAEHVAQKPMTQLARENDLT